MASARRGRDQRLVSRCRVELDRPSGPVEAESEDLSARGVFVRTDAMVARGEEIDLRLTLPGGDIIALYARVAHVLTRAAARALGRHPGIGLELIGPDTPARMKLRAHVDSLRTEITSPGLVAPTQLVVAEPQRPQRARLVHCLEGAGFKVTGVASAPEALAACEVWRPDAIVAAAQMDTMTGVDLAYAMAEHATLSDVPLVLIGNDGDLARLEAFRAGVRDYVPVPYTEEELVLRVHRVAAPPAPVTNPGLRGALGDISLPTLLSLFEFEKKSGVLLLVRTGELARLFVSDGRILKIETSASAGTPREKVMRVLDWRDGQFEFTPAAIGGRDEIGLSATQLLLEHARVNDEAAQARTAGRRR